jgi:hypothetical protein
MKGSSLFLGKDTNSPIWKPEPRFKVKIKSSLALLGCEGSGYLYVSHNCAMPAKAMLRSHNMVWRSAGMLERPSLRAKAPVPSPMMMALRSTGPYSLMCTVPWFTVFVITVLQISYHVPVLEEK